MVALNLDEIDEPIKLDSFQGNLFDGLRYNNEKQLVILNDGRIEYIARGSDEYESQSFPDSITILPGGINLHCHGRDAFDILPGEKGDQTYKEDSYTLSLALAQGGATRGVCMSNLAQRIQTQESYDRQLEWINSALPHRRKPITPLSMYALVSPGSKPAIDRALHKLLWNTFGPTNFDSDRDVDPTLANYTGKWVTAHCETIAGIKLSEGAPWHIQRPKEAGIEAVRIFLAAAEKYKFHPHIAHISSVEEALLAEQFKQRGVPVTYELTPQVVTLSFENFVDLSGYDIRYLQQNPPIRTEKDRKANHVLLKKADIYVDDHAPHTIAEKEKGMSGMPQASTTGQLFLEKVTEKHITLADYVKKRSIMPGRILERELGIKEGQIRVGYAGSFTLVSMGKKSRVRNEDVLSKCGWTPYRNMEFSNTIEGVVVNGILYTQKALQNLR